MNRSFLLACLLALLAPAMAAEKGPPLLAVLEFDAPPEVMDPDGLGILTDSLRSAVKKEVGGRYKVLTRETMTEIVPPEQLRCFVGKCVAEIGRMLQAPYIIAGNVRSIGVRKVLTIEAYESNGGQLLGSEQIKGPNADALLDELDEKARGLVRTWLSLKAEPAAAAPAKVTEGRLGASDDFDVGEASDVIASFDSEPAGAVVLVDGKVACKATPCTKSVAAGRHDVTMSLDQYDDAAQTVDLSAKRKSVKLDLAAAFGLLDVVTNPSGVPVSIDGKVVGTSPITGLRVDPGGHEVLVKDRCRQELGEKVAVEKGQTRRVSIEALPRYAGLAITAADEKGNDLEADVEVDGERLGATPLRAKVPMCAKEVVVKASGGRTWQQALALKEKEVLTVQATPRQSCPDDMVLIPAGTFTMGSEDDPEASANEKPAHRVSISTFCMAKTEVTQSEWLRVMGRNPSRYKGAERPVESVSWNDAVAYCNKRSQREGLRPAYDANGNFIFGANGYSLPTEAEWEYGARAGSKTSRYGDLKAIAWYGDVESDTHDVATKRPNEWGLFDMLGNVSEWTSDWYANYTIEDQRDPRGASSGTERVQRGGVFFHGAKYVRAAIRVYFSPETKTDYLGFRPRRPLP